MEGGLNRDPNFLGAAQEGMDDKNDALFAAKEALVAITNRFSLDVLMMAKAAEATRKAVMSYNYMPREQHIDDLKEVVIHTVEEVLSEKGMHVPDIMNAFEEQLDDKLPKQGPRE